MLRQLICIYGPKGSGKTTLAEQIAEEVPETRLVDTYTDRAERCSGETGHTFISPEEFTDLSDRGVIDLEGKALGENYRIGVSTDDLQSRIDEGVIPLLATRVPELIAGVNRRYPVANMRIDGATERNFEQLEGRESANHERLRLEQNMLLTLPDIQRPVISYQLGAPEELVSAGVLHLLALCTERAPAYLSGCLRVPYQS